MASPCWTQPKPNSKKKRLPLPGALATESSPPMRLTSCRASASPRPRPLFDRVSDSSPRAKGSKSLSLRTASMPGPLSATTKSRRHPPSSRPPWASCTLHSTEPVRVYLTALSSRMRNTSSRCRSSPSTTTGTAGSSVKISSNCFSRALPATLCRNSSSRRGN